MHHLKATAAVLPAIVSAALLDKSPVPCVQSQRICLFVVRQMLPGSGRWCVDRAGKQYQAVSQMETRNTLSTRMAVCGRTAANVFVSMAKMAQLIAHIKCIFGMGLGKLIRSTKSKAVLYAHIVCQFSGLALATAGLIIALVDFENPTDCPYHHGQLGIAVMALLYFQFLNGLFRPHTIEDYEQPSVWDRIRAVWEHVHSFLGHATFALAVVNCVLGILILSNFFNEVDLSKWIAGFAATVVTIVLVIAALGRYQTQRQDRTIALLTVDLDAAETDDDDDDDDDEEEDDDDRDAATAPDGALPSSKHVTQMSSPSSAARNGNDADAMPRRTEPAKAPSMREIGLVSIV